MPVTPRPVGTANASRPAPPQLSAERLNPVALGDTERLVTSGHRSIEVNMRGTRARGVEPTTLAGEASSSAVTAYGARAALPGHEAGPSLTADRQTLLLNTTVQVHSHATSGYAGGAGGVLLAGATVQETEQLSSNVFALGNKGFVASGVIQKLHTESLTLTGGSCGWAGGGTTIKALERRNNWIKVEQSRSRSAGGLLLGSASGGALGVGGRLTLTSSKETVLRRWLRPEAAAPLLQSQDHGLRTFLTNKAIALGMAEPPLRYPNLADPKSFAAHDEVIGTVQGSLTGSLALATPVAVTGAHYTRSGEFELVVHHRKNAETRFKETLTAIISPKKVTHAISASVDLPLLAELHHTVSHSDITREGWSFEVGEPEALEAYLQLLKGVLPGASVALASTDPLDVAKLNALMGAEKLPRGVTRVFTERARLVTSRATGGGLTLPRYIPGLKWAGLGAEQRASHIDHSIADAGGAVAGEHHTLELEKQQLRAGVRTEKISVQNQQIAVAQEPALHERGVALSADDGPPEPEPSAPDAQEKKPPAPRASPPSKLQLQPPKGPTGEPRSRPPAPDKLHSD